MSSALNGEERVPSLTYNSQRLKSYFEPLQDKIMATLDEMTTRICQTRRKPKVYFLCAILDY